MGADFTGMEHRRGDLSHASPPSRHAGRDDDLGVECLRKLAADSRRALDAAVARLGPLDAGEGETRARLAEAQAALLARDTEYAESVRSLLDRLSELEGIRGERDAARRHALAAESCCRALERRFEHVVMKIPRRLASGLRSRFRSAMGGTRDGFPSP